MAGADGQGAAEGVGDERRQDARLRIHRARRAVRQRKFWQNFTVAGGKVDEKGDSKGWNISKAAFRAMIDSALGLDPQDVSEAAKQKRVIQGLKQLDGIAFAARIMIEPASNPQYKDANKLANVVPPDEPKYAAIMRGETVAPEPVNAKPRKVEDRPSPRRPGEPDPGRRAGTVPWAEPSAPQPARPAARTGATPARRATPVGDRAGAPP